jgi:hypothetical protein
MLFDALLASRGVGPIGTAVAYSPAVREVDRRAKRTATKAVKRGSTAASKKLSKALKVVNKKARNKKGQLRAGYDMSRVMREAHRLAKK